MGGAIMLFATIKEVIDDLEKGRQQAVLFAGVRRFYYSPSQFEVDVIDILRELEYLEVPFKFPEISYEERRELYNNDAYEYLEHCIEKTWGDISKKEGDNTYNWNARVSNNILFHLYEVPGRIIAAVEIHLHGDVRANYSPWIILSCSSHEEFIETLCAASKHVRLETEKWTADISINACSEVMIVDAQTPKDKNGLPQHGQFETWETEPEDLIKKIEEELGLLEEEE